MGSRAIKEWRCSADESKRRISSTNARKRFKTFGAEMLTLTQENIDVKQKTKGVKQIPLRNLGSPKQLCLQKSTRVLPRQSW